MPATSLATTTRIGPGMGMNNGRNVAVARVLVDVRHCAVAPPFGAYTGAPLSGEGRGTGLLFAWLGTAGPFRDGVVRYVGYPRTSSADYDDRLDSALPGPRFRRCVSTRAPAMARPPMPKPIPFTLKPAALS